MDSRVNRFFYFALSVRLCQMWSCVEWGTWKLCFYLFPDGKFLVLLTKNLPKPGFNVLSFPLA